jgi:hypothetical protein
MHAILAKAKPTYIEGNQSITMVFEKEVLVDKGDATDTDIKDFFAEELGKEVSVKYIKDSCNDVGQSDFLDIRKMIHMEITEENE